MKAITIDMIRRRTKGLLRSTIRDRRMRNVFKGAKRNYKNALITLQYSKTDNTEALCKSLRHYAVLDTTLLRRERVISRILGLVIGLLYYGIVIGLLFELESGISVNVGFVSLLGSVVAALVICYPISKILKNPGSQVLACFLVALVIFGATMVGSHIPHKSWIIIPHASNLNSRSIVIDGFVLFAASVATFGVIAGLSAIAFTFITVPGRMRNPNIVVIDTLVGVLTQLDKKTSSATDMATKAAICHHLQFAATYLEEGVPRALALPDPGTRQVLQQKLTSSATYLREIQLWVALAKDETQNDTCDAIAHYIDLIAQGKYDLLPNGTLAMSSRSKTSKLATFGRTLAVAVVPFGCLIGARYAGLQLSSEFTGWAVVVTLAWAAITLVSAIDPLYKTRLKDMQDLIATIRGKD